MKKRILSTILALTLTVSTAIPIVSLAKEDVKVETEKMKVERISGIDRYDTAVKASQETFKNESKYVVIASGEDFIDALVGGSLTSQVNAPLLLVKKNSVSKEVLEEIKRLEPEEIFILGGANTISEKVEKEIANLGFKIERLAGKDRVETALKISGKRFRLSEPTSQASGDLDAAIDGNDFADALSAGPFIGEMAKLKKGFYQLYPYMKGTTVDGIDMVFGGTSSVPRGPVEKYRFAGADRYETAVEVAKAYKNVLRKDIDTIILVDGTKYPDALASASVASMNNGAVLLTNPKKLSKLTKEYIVGNKNIKNIIIVGGENSVSSSIENELKSIDTEIEKSVEEVKPTEPTEATKAVDETKPTDSVTLENK